LDHANCLASTTCTLTSLSFPAPVRPVSPPVARLARQELRCTARSRTSRVAPAAHGTPTSVATGERPIKVLGSFHAASTHLAVHGDRRGCPHRSRRMAQASRDETRERPDCRGSRQRCRHPWHEVSQYGQRRAREPKLLRMNRWSRHTKCAERAAGCLGSRPTPRGHEVHKAPYGLVLRRDAPSERR